MAFCWTLGKSHNKSNSWVIKKSHGFFMCFSLHFLKSRLFHGPLIVNFSKYIYRFFNGTCIFISWTRENTLSFGHENLVNKVWKSCEFSLINSQDFNGFLFSSHFIANTCVILSFPKYSNSHQGAKKVIFTACLSGKLKLAFTSPKVISTSPQNFLMSKIDFTVLLLVECLKTLYLPVGSVTNRIH